MKGREALDLAENVGRRVDEEPRLAAADGQGVLGARPDLPGAAPRFGAVWAGAVPLGEASPGRRPQDSETHQTSGCAGSSVRRTSLGSAKRGPGSKSFW